MSRTVLTAIVLSLALLAAGCGSNSSGGGQGSVGAEIAGEEATSCDPNYSGACLDPNASDYDCEGGSGNGPYYTGTVTVVGADPYGLDADGDGTGCETG